MCNLSQTRSETSPGRAGSDRSSDAPPPPLCLPGGGLREQELLLLLRGGAQPHRGSTFLAPRPVQGPGLRQGGGAGRGRAPEVLASPVPHGRVGKLPAGLHRGQGQRRGPGHGPHEQHQVSGFMAVFINGGRLFSDFGGNSRKTTAQLAAAKTLRAGVRGWTGGRYIHGDIQIISRTSNELLSATIISVYEIFGHLNVDFLIAASHTRLACSFYSASHRLRRVLLPLLSTWLLPHFLYLPTVFQVLH